MELVVLSIALGTDLFSVAIPIGMNSLRFVLVFRAAVTFSLFHIGLILAGYYMGHFLGSVVEQVGIDHVQYPLLTMQNWANILGAFVLTVLGVHMIKENLTDSQTKEKNSSPLQGKSLLLLAASVSIDALAAGFSMGMLDVNLIKLSAILGIVIFLIAILGLSVGHRIGSYIGKRAEVIGGAVLIFLGAHIFWTMLQS